MWFGELGVIVELGMFMVGLGYILFLFFGIWEYSVFVLESLLVVFEGMVFFFFEVLFLDILEDGFLLGGF